MLVMQTEDLAAERKTTPSLYLVAMCDVLEFSKFVASNSLKDVYDKYLTLRAQVRSSQGFVGFKPRTERPVPVVDGIVFSDTILFWAPATGAMEVLPMNLSLLLALTLGSMPLRVGLALGQCVIDPENDVYIGQPIIDAYLTESGQNWVGGAYHPSCWALPGFRQRLCDQRTAVKYPVPLNKKGPPDPIEYALNWALLSDFSTEQTTRATLEEQEQNAPSEAKEKWQNARAFYELHR